MESIREIVVPKNNKIELTVPDNFIGAEVEVLAFKIERGDDLKSSQKKSFNAIKLDLTNSKFNREEAEER